MNFVCTLGVLFLLLGSITIIFSYLLMFFFTHQDHAFLTKSDTIIHSWGTIFLVIGGICFLNILLDYVL